MAIEAFVRAFAIFGAVGLLVALAVPAMLVGEIGARDFHRIPEHARNGNRLAKWYLRAIWLTFGSFVGALVLELGRTHL
jgi:hypothetical protein